MKALCVSGMPNTAANSNRSEEAHALAKKALTLRMTSHVCWHVYGLLHRADRNYAEAIKCYKRALKLEPNLTNSGGDGQILRDLSHLQIQERDVEGFVESRAALLAARPGPRYNWLPLAVGHHLTGVAMMEEGNGGNGGGANSSSSSSSSSSAAGGATDAAATSSSSSSLPPLLNSSSEPFLLAVSILDQYDSMASAHAYNLPDAGSPEEFERSEIALYGAEVALEGGDAAGALARVEACLLALEDPKKAAKLPWPPIVIAQSSAAAADAVAKPNIGAAPPARDLRCVRVFFFEFFFRGRGRKGGKKKKLTPLSLSFSLLLFSFLFPTRGARDLRARCLEALGPSRAQEAQSAWRLLLDASGDAGDARCHDGLRRASGLPEIGQGIPSYTPAQIAGLRALYDDIRSQHPRSSMVSPRGLDFETGKNFLAAATPSPAGW